MKEKLSNLHSYCPSRSWRNAAGNILGALFLFIGTLHLLRLFYGWEVVVGGVEIPAWVSVLALLIAFYAATIMFRLDSDTKGEQDRR